MNEIGKLVVKDGQIVSTGVSASGLVRLNRESPTDAQKILTVAIKTPNAAFSEIWPQFVDIHGCYPIGDLEFL